MSVFDALIIGAGPAGSTAARLLAKAGWSVAIVEKSEFPRRKVCGEFISATSLPLLYDDDLRGEFLTNAGPDVRRVGLFTGGTALSSEMPRAEKSVAGWGRALGRDRLDLLLSEAAARSGAKLWQPWKVAGLERDRNGYRCDIVADGKTSEIRARLVIAATGSWERPVAGAGFHTERKAADLLAFKAHFTGGKLARDLMPLLAFPGGYGGMVHTDGGRISLSCCIRRDVLEHCRREHPAQQAGDSVLQHIRKTTKGVRDALDNSKQDGPWLGAGPIRPGFRPRYSDGIFFAGNIAGEAHPIVAEGISMAMQSAWLLCRRLQEHQDRIVSEMGAAGRAYSKDWRRAFAPRIHAAALFAQLAMWPKSAKLVPLIAKFPAILSWGAGLSGKTVQLLPQPRV
jgi:flavin-dependent dehydrogenase